MPYLPLSPPEEGPVFLSFPTLERSVFSPLRRAKDTTATLWRVPLVQLPLVFGHPVQVLAQPPLAW
jgi:hypothetical protein